MTGGITRCQHCRALLDGAEQRLGRTHCHRAACRSAAVRQAQQQRWRRIAQEAPRRAGLPDAPVLWLDAAERRLEPVTATHRSAIAARWRAAWADGHEHRYDGVDSATNTPPAADALCAHCAGHCCNLGGAHDAFVESVVLQRWLDAHPDASLDEAIACYLQHLPAQHVVRGCLFQGERGCTLPRAMRADVCNRYRCDALVALSEQVAQDPAAAAVVLTRDGQALESAVVFRHGQATPLPGEPLD